MIAAIRWMIREDLDEVMEIENESFSLPWSEKQFLDQLKKRECIGMVAEINDRVVGVIVYELNRDHIFIKRIAVSSDYLRMGIGRALVSQVVGKMNPCSRKKILINVPESSLAGHLFLKSIGFRAVKVMRNYHQNGEDDYCFRYTAPTDNLSVNRSK
jgi:ribosomal-protein-alanine N-acetyltransferase